MDPGRSALENEEVGMNEQPYLSTVGSRKRVSKTHF